MTVTDLIEALQRLPGAPDLRTVTIRVDIHREHRGNQCIEGDITRVEISRDVVVLKAWGWEE